MNGADWFEGKKITIMGLGTLGGGLGVSKWLLRRGARLTVTDLREKHALKESITALTETYRQAKEEGLRVFKPQYTLERHDEKHFTDTDMVIRNPAVPRDHKLLKLARKGGVETETDISLFFRLCPFPITAVTGTKGKTTTTALLGMMAKAHDRRAVIGGNIRISPFDSLDRLLKEGAKRRPRPVPVVLELSSWQLEGLERHRTSPHIAVITNILEDHLNRYDGMEDYAAAKGIITAYQDSSDIAVLNADDHRIATLLDRTEPKAGIYHAGRRFWFTETGHLEADGCYVSDGQAMIRDQGRAVKLFPLSKIAIPGRHNIKNVLAACAAAYHMGIVKEDIVNSVAKFRGVSGRLELVTTKRGIRYINDTTGTTPDASIAAMEAMKSSGGRNIILLAGGADKELRYGKWAESVGQSVKRLILFDGSATPKMQGALIEKGIQVPMSRASSMKEAMHEAREHADKGDVILLSPACASFGLFKNEFDRGDQFTELAKQA